MNLTETRGSNWHHIVAKDINIVLRWNAADIYSSLKETIVSLRIASIDQSIVVISESERAVHVQDDIAVDVLEEVTLRLLKVQEMQRLITSVI